VICSACGSGNEAGRKFCGECGAALARACGRAVRPAGQPFWLAVSKLELAEWLILAGRAPEVTAPLAEAGEAFDRLRAVPWIDRADHARAGTEAPAAAGTQP
jgi:hypothetical protein